MQGMDRRVERSGHKEKTMKKKMCFALCALLLAVSGASMAAVHIQCDQAHGKCVPPKPPVPPAPPAPPAPPPPPVSGPDGATAPIPPLPAMPAIPAIPAPPPPPKLPDVPAGAHAACASKAEGSSVVYTIKKGETMAGVCERENGKMVFQLRRYDLDD
jgi:hypothetical protein